MSHTAFYVSANIISFLFLYNTAGDNPPGLIMGYLSGVGVVTFLLIVMRLKDWIYEEEIDQAFARLEREQWIKERAEEIVSSQEKPTYDDKGEVYPRYENGKLILQAPFSYDYKSAEERIKGKIDAIGKDSSLIEHKLAQARIYNAVREEYEDLADKAREALNERFIEDSIEDFRTGTIEDALKDCHDGPIKEHP